jgi:hypothetical protein
LLTLLAMAACGDPPPSFTLKVPTSVQAAPGAPAYVDVTIERAHGRAEPVTFTVDAPPGFTASMSPESATDAARLRVDIPRGTGADQYAVKLTARTAAGMQSEAQLQLDVLRAFESPTKPIDISVRLDALFYTSGQKAKVTVDFGSRPPPATISDVVLVSSESKDVERLQLVSIGGNLFESSQMVIQESDAPGTVQDGLFTLPAGGIFFAMFGIDRTQPGYEGFEAAHFSDFAFIDGERPGTPASRVQPALALSDDEKVPVPGARAMGTLLHVGDGPGSGIPIQLATEELIVFHKDPAELARFIASSNGQVLDTQDVEGELPFASLVQVDPRTLPPSRLALLRGLLEDRGELLASKAEVQGIYGLALAFRLDGFVVAVNPRLSYHAAPAVREPEHSQLLPSMRMRGSAGSAAPCVPGGLMGSCVTNVPALWTYLDLFDLDSRRVNVAVLDMGFAPNMDFRSKPDGSIDQCDVTGRLLTCGPGRALGPPTVGASLVGPRVWHGTGVVTTLGGIVDNEFGAAGTGGQIAVPMLYKYDLGAYAFDLGVGIRHAVQNGAQVVNISAGYPCKAVTRVGPDFDYCSIEGRAGICGVITAAAHAAAIAFCTSPAAGIPLIGQAICGGLAGAAVTATNACLSTLAFGNLRAPMHSAVREATLQGVPVVASAGNRLPPEKFPSELRAFINFNEARTEVWGIIPASLPDVVAVGAAREVDLGNEHFFGERVDVWAPIESSYSAPVSPDDSSSRQDQTRIGGTSASAPYVSGVIAAMQAANPSLDPKRATAAERATAVSRVRAILASTATSNTDLRMLGWKDDPVERRNLINPLAAVLEASRGVQPDLTALGYDTSLNFAEALTADDVQASAQPIPFDTSVAGTVFAFSPAEQDQDWKSFTVPTQAGRVFGSDVVLRWVGGDEPSIVASPAIPRISTSTDGPERLSTYRVVRGSGAAVTFAVTAPGGSDAPYKVTVSAPVVLTPTMTITEPVVSTGQTLCANRQYTYRATAEYPHSTLPVPSNEITWLIDGAVQQATGSSVSFSRPAGTDTFTVRAFGSTATLTITFVTCTAAAEITQPAANVREFANGQDTTGRYLTLNFSGRALNGAGNPIDPATLYFEWTTNRGDLQPGAPTTGSQVLGTGASITGIRIYVAPGSTIATHVITLTVRQTMSGPVLSTDNIQVTVEDLI